MDVVNLHQKFEAFSDFWSPKSVAQFNGQDVQLWKLQGDFIWHSHPASDELFLVLKGELTIQLRDGDVHLSPGDLYVVSQGVEHRPSSREDVFVLVAESRGTQVHFSTFAEKRKSTPV